MRKLFINVGNDLCHCSLLDKRARKVNIVRHNELDGLLDERPELLRVCGGDHVQIVLNEGLEVRGNALAQGILARHHRQATRKILDHHVRRLAQANVVGLKGKVLQHELSCRDARNCARALDDGRDDFLDGPFQRNLDALLELRLLLKQQNRGVHKDKRSDRRNRRRRDGCHVDRVGLAGGHLHTPRGGVCGTARRRQGRRTRVCGKCKSKVMRSQLGELVRRGDGERALWRETGAPRRARMQLNLLENRRRGYLVDVEANVLAQHLHLEFQVELEIGQPVQLLQHRHYCHQPRIRGAKHSALACLEHFGNERHDIQQMFPFVCLQQ
eukprot:Opistho-2@44396